MINETEIRAEFEQQVDELLARDNGHDMWCWIRRRAAKLLECELGDDRWEEIGSSDVSGKVYQIWRECYLLAPRKSITDSLGFQINSRVMEYSW